MWYISSHQDICEEGQKTLRYNHPDLGFNHSIYLDINISRYQNELFEA